MGHPARMRVSDAEREAVVAHLSHATGEGRLTLDEFGTRSRQAYASRTRIELYSLIDDLPPPAGEPGAAPRAAGRGPALRGSAPAADPVGAASTMALVFGGLSLPLGFCLPLGILSGVTGVLLALIALGGGRRTARQRTMAIVGLVCGILGIVAATGQVVFFGLSIS